jgi:hypothetical protein
MVAFSEKPTERDDDPWAGVPVISRYTRAEAIADGVLVDLMQPGTVKTVLEAGIRMPLAMTATAYAAAVCPVDGSLPPGQDATGRLWDVLWMLKLAIRKSGGQTDRTHFQVRVWNGTRFEVVRLWALCGPGDDAEPTLTIMLEGED